MSSRQFGTVAVTVEPPLAWITLSRPEKLNALDHETLEGIAAAAAAVDETTDVAAAIFGGEGSDFSSGADVRTAVAGSPQEVMRSIRASAEAGRSAIAAVRDMRPVTIALVHGRAIGGAVVLAAACDLRIATDDAVFWLPEVDLGIPVGWGGVPLLVAEMGPSLARDLVLTCRTITAEELRQAGFVSRLVARGRAHQAARELGMHMAAKPAAAVTRSKQQFRDAAERSPGGGSDADLILAALAESGRTGLSG
jgi:enoyl-CoA hydratase/carnithine racemase